MDELIKLLGGLVKADVEKALNDNASDIEELINVAKRVFESIITPKENEKEDEAEGNEEVVELRIPKGTSPEEALKILKEHLEKDEAEEKRQAEIDEARARISEFHRKVADLEKEYNVTLRGKMTISDNSGKTDVSGYLLGI